MMVADKSCDRISQLSKQGAYSRAWMIIDACTYSKYLFNVDEFYQMAQVGIFTEDDRVELIEGEVIELGRVSPRHAACVMRLNLHLCRQFDMRNIVSVHNPVRLDHYSEPLPDITLLKWRDDFYASSHRTPADVLLIIEVADTSVDFDRRIKLPLYVRAGIPETWVMVLPKDLIEVHSQPLNGKYQKVQRLKRGKRLASPTVAGLGFNVDDLLG
jgi:Uma2 family endonuclease